VERIDVLMDEEKLNPSIKGFLMNTKNKINSLAKKRSRLGKLNKQVHYRYLKTISE